MAEKLEAKDLRIGNWVSVPMCAAHWQIATIGKGSCTIDDTNNDLSEEENDIPHDEIYGIPLTEEWLLKFGFGKCEEHSLSKDISERLSVIYDWHFKMLYLIITSPHNEQQVGLTHIEHVHELQNFWYSIAAEDLTEKR